MQNLVSNLTQFSNYQIIFMSIALITGFFLFVVTATIRSTTISSIVALTITFGTIMLYIGFSNQQNDAVKNHEYTVIRNEQTLEIESKSDIIKSHKFKIDSEDHDHIYIKTSSLFGTTNYIIDKSDIDKNIINVN